MATKKINLMDPPRRIERREREKHVEMLHRRRAVRRAMLTGKTDIQQLADKFKVSYATMQRDQRWVIEQWAIADGALYVNDTERRNQRVQSLQLVLQEAFAGFRKSQTDAVEVVERVFQKKCFACNGRGKTKAKTDGSVWKKCTAAGCKHGKIEVVERQVSRSGQAGDPSFLNVMRGVINDIAKLEGLTQPTQIDLNVKSQETVLIELLARVEKLPEVIDDGYIETIAKQRLAGATAINGANDNRNGD